MLAQLVHFPVIGAHALLHDFRSYADHVGIADLAPLDDADDITAHAELSLKRLHAEDSRVGSFETGKNFGRRVGGGTRDIIFDAVRCGASLTVFDRLFQARGNFFSWPIKDESDGLTGQDGKAGFNGVARSREERRI